jgi:hypothetical protein
MPLCVVPARIGPIPCMPLENILIPCMPLAPHVIDTKKYTYMPLSGTQGMSIKYDGIPGIFSPELGMTMGNSPRGIAPHPRPRNDFFPAGIPTNAYRGQSPALFPAEINRQRDPNPHLNYN